MKRILIAAAALASIFTLVACNRESTAPAASTTPDAPTEDAATKQVATETPPADVQVVSETAHAPVSPKAAAAASTFDTKAYAGTFAAGDTRLAITADGAFTLDQGDNHVTGTWTLEDDGTHLLFDPDSKSEQDRRYKMVGNDELRPVGGDGTALLRAKS